MRYRALPDASRAKASLIWLIGKCSVCGTTWCRAAKSSIVAIATGEPTGEPETLRCCMMSENAATGIGSSTAPTTCSRPFGASAPISASQSSVTLTVLIRRLKLPPSFPIAAGSWLETTWCAPKPFASSNLLALDVNAVTSRASKLEEAKGCGAHHVVSSQDPAAIGKLGGSFNLLISTVNVTLDWDALIGALAPNGRLHVVGAVLEPIPVVAFSLILQQRSVSGSPTGSPVAIETMLDFAARHNVAPQTEHFPMSQINEAFAQLAAGKARYRIVLDADC